MSEENAPQKERFLREVEQQLLRKELDVTLLEDGLIHVRWNEKPLCSVDRDGIVRFRPADITGPEVDRQLRTVIQTAGHVKELSLIHIFCVADRNALSGFEPQHSGMRRIFPGQNQKSCARHQLHHCQQSYHRLP